MVGSAIFLPYRVTISPLAFNSYFVGRYFEYANNLFLIILSPINFIIPSWFFPAAMITVVVPKW